MFSFMSNLAYQGPRFKDLIRGKMEEVIEKFKKILEVLPYKDNNVSLILMILALIANLCTNADIRDYVSGSPYNLLEHIIQQTVIMFKEKPVGYVN